MKRLSITFGTILLVLGCFAFSPAAKAEQPVVGLWQVEYTGLANHQSCLRTFLLTSNSTATAWNSNLPTFSLARIAWEPGNRWAI